MHYVEFRFSSGSSPLNFLVVRALRRLSRVFAIVSICGGLALAQSVSISAPANGASVVSPVHITANANGSGHPVSAFWIYVDNQPLYKTTASTVDTYISMSQGSHHIVPVAWNSVGGVATTSLNVTVNPAGVSVSSPAAGTTVASPVRFVASANAPGGRIITAMRIYVDSATVYTIGSPSVNTSISMSAGSHTLSIQAWDNTGAVYVKTMSIKVGSSLGSQYSNNFNAVSKYVSQFSQSDGAILYAPTEIEPYYANIAATGMTKDPARMPQVTAWIKWYINHLNWPDRWGLYGTMYDYSVSNGAESATQNADSTDSYAATFLTLVWNAWQSGNASARSYILGLSYQLDVIGGVLIQTQQSDGLTWAKPDYQIKYLMDNCEAYRGLRDLASIYQSAFGDITKAAYYNAAADHMLNGILSMWLNGRWAVYKDGIGRLAAPNLGTWYADASAQVFPVLMGVVNSSDYRAQQAYAAFNAAWPGWTKLSFNSQDPFPWCLLANAAAAMGDTERVGTYINTVQGKYGAGYPWPFYNAEAGWFLRANKFMIGLGL